MSARLPTAASVDWRRVGNAIGLVVILAVVFLFVSIAAPQIAGADHSYVVRSDSMSPAIGAGSVVYVSDVSESTITTGDVITYQSGSAGSKRVTHRVTAIVEESGERNFRTKGDANEAVDSELVSPAQVVGRVSFHVPYIGYAVTFAQTDLGLISLVVLPATLLAVTELRDLIRAARSEETDKSPSGDKA